MKISLQCALFSLGFALVTVGTAPWAQAANLLVDGDFETPALTAGVQVNTGFDASGDDLPGWQNIGGTYANSGFKNVAGSAESGSQFVFNRGGELGAFQITTYQLQAGDQLTLTWWVENSFQGGTQSVSLLDFASSGATYAGGAALATSTAAIPLSGTTSGYQQFTLTYTATAGDAGKYIGVSFANPNTAAQGGFTSFDNFNLTVASVPEPRVIGLILIALGCFPALSIFRRFRVS